MVFVENYQKIKEEKTKMANPASVIEIVLEICTSLFKDNLTNRRKISEKWTKNKMDY